MTLIPDQHAFFLSRWTTKSARSSVSTIGLTASVVLAVVAGVVFVARTVGDCPASDENFNKCFAFSFFIFVLVMEKC